MFKTRRGVKGRLNNVKKNCTIGRGGLPLLFSAAALNERVSE